MPANEPRPVPPRAARADSAPAGPEAARSIQAEHDELRALLGDLEAAPFSELLPLLGQLKTLLVEHFDTEEGPDGLEAVTQKQPQFLPRLSEIFDEHRAFLTGLEQLTARVQTCAKEQQFALEAVQALAKQLRTHEAKENELLGDVLYTDLGGGA
ncbi:hemerythrin domain-containing protein [bacterium]|nr:hemerythrin domain-containing protein [bacterium]